MRRTHRVVCAFALTGLAPLVYLAYAGSRGASDAAPRDWAIVGGDPAKAVAETDRRVEVPTARQSSVPVRDRVATIPSEWIADWDERMETTTQGAVGASSAEVRRDRQGRSRSFEERVSPRGSDAPIEFDRVSVAPGALSVGVTGVDWGAPRPLVLWRMEGEEYARLASAQSREDGHFDFGQVVVPNRGLELAVTAGGAQPRPADWARGLELQPSEFRD